METSRYVSWAHAVADYLPLVTRFIIAQYLYPQRTDYDALAHVPKTVKKKNACTRVIPVVTNPEISGTPFNKI